MILIEWVLPDEEAFLKMWTASIWRADGIEANSERRIVRPDFGGGHQITAHMSYTNDIQESRGSRAVKTEGKSGSDAPGSTEVEEGRGP